MSSIASSPAATSPTENPQTEEKRLRARARRRASFCPGAGWALLGHGQRGALVLVSVVVCWAAIVWMLLTLSPASIWATGLSTLFACAAWVVELLDVGWCMIRHSPDSLLVRRFAFTTFAVWCGAFIIPLLIATRFGSVEIVDDRMAPAIEPGERLIYHRHVGEADLMEGRVVLYRLSPEAKVGMPGELVVARMLAVPDDELAIQGSHYVVNRQMTRYRALPAPPQAPLRVPSPPKILTVPDQRYFVVHDSPSTGIDGQQLGWVRRVDVVSARLFHFGKRGLLQPVE